MNRQSPNTSKRPRYGLVERSRKGNKVIQFPQMRGRIVEKIELSTTSEVHSIAITFQDDSELNLEIAPRFTILADLTDWKSGDARVIKRWSPIQSVAR